MFYIFSVLEVLWQDLSVTRILPERHKDTRASQGVRSRAPESRALHHDRVQPGTRTIQSSTSNNIPEWAWFHQLFQVLCQLFHFTLLECIYWHTLFSPSATPMQVWCTEEALLCTMTAIQRCLCTRSAFPMWMKFKRSKRGSGRQGQKSLMVSRAACKVAGKILQPALAVLSMNCGWISESRVCHSNRFPGFLEGK